MANKAAQSEGKSWFGSKLNWVGILQIVIAIAAQISEGSFSPDVKAVALFAAGVATLVIRTWFTSQPIK